MHVLHPVENDYSHSGVDLLLLGTFRPTFACKSKQVDTQDLYIHYKLSVHSVKCRIVSQNCH